MRDQEFTEFLFRCQILGHLPSDRLADTARFLIRLADQDIDSMKSWVSVVIRIVGKRRQDAAKMFRMLMLSNNHHLCHFLFVCDPVREVCDKFGSSFMISAADHFGGMTSLEDIQSLDLEGK